MTDLLNTIIEGDCLEKLKELPDNAIDAVISDPPYELGFMGKSWDNTGIANNKDMWAECLRVLKPGGHLLAFSGTRTYHRMASAIEDAGFEVRDMIEWVYGSGFPKSTNIAIRIDKEKGLMKDRGVGTSFARKDMGDGNILENGKAMPNHIGISPEAKQWEGWGTALKPAHEPICMARKPLAEKTVAENVLKYGTGGINIDGSRVDFVSEEDRKESTTKNQHEDFGTKPMTNNNVYGDYSMIKPKNFNPPGRFPANLIHDNSEEVRECFPETKSGKAIRSNSGGKTFGGENTKPVMEDLGYEDGGGNASRFFKSIIYQAKASKAERNRGCEGLEIKQTTGGGGMNNTEDDVCGKYGSIKSAGHNHHPTVKPIALMEYLVKLVSREGAIVLDPFAGSGSTLIACKKQGRNYIGIEKEPEYVEIAKKRLEA